MQTLSARLEEAGVGIASQIGSSEWGIIAFVVWMLCAERPLRDIVATETILSVNGHGNFTRRLRRGFH
jgi:hypothetical protein